MVRVTKEVAATAVGLLQEGLLAVQATEVGGYHLVEALSRLATAQTHAQDAESTSDSAKGHWSFAMSSLKILERMHILHFWLLRK